MQIFPSPQVRKCFSTANCWYCGCLICCLYIFICSFTRQPVSSIYLSLHPWQIATQIKLLLWQLKEFFSKKVFLVCLNWYKDAFKRLGQLSQFFPQFFTLWFLCCDSNLDLQSNQQRFGAWLIDLTSFFLWKILDIVLEYWKLSELCFVIGKTFGLYVTVKWIISHFWQFLVPLKFRISLTLNMPASISDLWYFCSSNVFFFSFFKAFFFYIFIFNNGTYSSCKRKWYIW